MTKFFGDNTELNDKSTVEDFLKSNDIKYKKVENSFFVKITIDHSETSKVTQGIKPTKGKEVYYYFVCGSVLNISNHYGWNGRGLPYSTSNYIKFVKKVSGIEKLEEELKKLLSIQTTLTLIDINKSIDTYFGIKHKELKKYEDFEEYKNNNLESLKKLILNDLGEYIYIYLDYSLINKYSDNKTKKVMIKLNIKDNTNTVLSYEKLLEVQKPLLKKINSKLVKKINYLKFSELEEILDGNLTSFDSEKITIRGKSFSIIEKIGDKFTGVEEVFAVIEDNLFEDKKFNITLDGDRLVITEDNMVSLDDVLKNLNLNTKITKEKGDLIREFINKTINTK